MGKRVCLGETLLLLLLVLNILRDGVDGKTSQQLWEVNKKLKMLNKPAVKSIKSEDGDIIDCVDMYKQPAFDHPALKNHTIQLRLSFDPAKTKTTPTPTPTEKKKQTSAITIVSQLWHKSGSCPKGTIPIRRIKNGDLLRAVSPKLYGRKSPIVAPTSVAPSSTHNLFPTTANITKTSNTIQPNSSRGYLITQGYNYIGAKADINVWQPYVDKTDEYSSAQIWLRNGDPKDYESVESGWVVNPSVYGDKQTRFFGYWTSDASMKTGCFDLTCPGFVQTSQQIALGASIGSISSSGGSQYQISISISQDPKTGNWWLAYGNNIIGYWPGTIFSLLAHSAIFVMWGGEVYSPRIGKIPHTTTHMGSGDYAEMQYGWASFVRNIRIIDYSLMLKFPEWVSSESDEVYCYHVYFHRSGYFAEPEFYFGGPGKNNFCP